ncbi:MAG: zinc ribbon domain-containing protein [Actinomycetota bacterium]
MKCPKCQADNPDDAEFCSLCYARFQEALRSTEIDEAARNMRDAHAGARLRCPSCGDLSPLDSQFCLRCGFVFEDLEALMVSAEEVERIGQEAEALKVQEMKSAEVEPTVITPESDGAEVMRGLSDMLGRGMNPRVHARGRNAVTYAMKIIALLGQDARASGNDLRFRVHLISEGSITHLEDVELEIILERL